jgi:hypothetical protein
MRASPWRSLARLPPLAVLVVAACAPTVDVNSLPPPCAPGNYLCPATGYCVPNVDTPVSTTDGGRDAASLTAASTVDNCLVGYSVRLGGSISIRVPFVQDVGTVTATTSSPDLTILPVRGADGSVVVSVTAHHAATRLGQTTVNITESTLGKAADRAVMVYISPITAASTLAGGKTTNPGTTDEPFLTFQQAAAAAAPGDTIILKSLTPLGQDALGNDVEQVEQDFASAPAVKLPANVTVASPSITTRSELHMPIVLEGDAILNDLDIEEPRLQISKPGSKVTLTGSTIVGKGIEIQASASTAPGAPPTTLTIDNRGSSSGDIRNDDPTLSSLSIAADNAIVEIDNGLIHSNSTAAAIYCVGNGAVISIDDGTVIENAEDGPSLELMKVSSLNVDTVKLRGVIEILDPSSVATINEATFEVAEEMTGEISFNGWTMTVDNSIFPGLAIVQNSGRVKLHNSQIANYMLAGYVLNAGLLDAGTMDEPGNNTFADFFYTNHSVSLVTQPTALSVTVKDPPADGVVATSSASMFNGMQPGTCTASQTENATMDMPGIVTITTPAYPIEVNFY